MNPEELSFDSFMSFDSKTRKMILNDDGLLKLMLRKNIKEKRFAHSLNVASLARDLALRHHVDENKAYLAGLLHDCTKDFDEQFHDSYLRYYDPGRLSMPLPCKHSYSAKYYLREKLNLHDKDILNAIYNHTICRSKDRLSMIIYIADKREPSRQIEDDILDLAYNDLYEAFAKLNWSVERYIREVKNERFIENRL